MSLRIFVDFILPPQALELLKSGTAGHQLVFPATPSVSVLAGPQRDPQFTTVDVAFGQPDPAMVAAAGRLRWIQISSSGITRYDTSDFRNLVVARNIAVCNSAKVYDDQCAMHALSFMLSQARSLPQALTTRTGVGSKEWHALRGSCMPMEGQTVLIVGFGAIGRRLAEMLRPFNMRVVGYRRKPRGDEGLAIVGESSLDATLAEADHVVDILPDSVGTRRFFSASRFSVMKPGSVFYNIGRGTTVDQEALCDALQVRRIKAAWLDVTDPEPLPDGHPLLSEPNCHVTPHVAGGQSDESEKLVRHFLANLQRFIAGKELIDRVM